MDLATQDVEQVSRGSHAGNLHVAVLVLALQLIALREYARLLVAELQPPLHTAGRVLGALPIVPVRQRHHQTGTLEPLGLARGDELIDDALRVVGKVTELGLPHDQRVGRSQRITVLEAETGTVSLDFFFFFFITKKKMY